MIRAGQTFLLLGLMLRAFIPVGYMIDTTSFERGTSLIIICPTGLEGLVEGTFLEAAFAEHASHMSDLQGHGEQGVHDNTPCIFAAMAALAVAFAILGFFLSLWPSIRIRVVPTDERRVNSAALGKLNVRAPPVFS